MFPQQEGFFTERDGRHTQIKAFPGTRDRTRERAFERLYLESYPIVYGYVRSCMSDESAVEDVVAEAFLRAARSFGSFDPKRAKFSTWVITIARNCMINHYRKERPAIALDDLPESCCAVPDSQDAVGDAELVDKLLACLDKDERELVVLKYRVGMRNVEIAKILDMNPSTVSTVLARSLTKMRKVAERSM